MHHMRRPAKEAAELVERCLTVFMHIGDAVMTCQQRGRLWQSFRWRELEVRRLEGDDFAFGNKRKRDLLTKPIRFFSAAFEAPRSQDYDKVFGVFNRRLQRCVKFAGSQFPYV